MFQLLEKDFAATQILQFVRSAATSLCALDFFNLTSNCLESIVFKLSDMKLALIINSITLVNLNLS